MFGMQSIRFSTALLLSLLLNGTLFWTLSTLTNVGFDIEVREASRIDFTRVRKDSETVSRRQDKVERELPQITPELPNLSMATADASNTVQLSGPIIDARGAMSNLSLGAGADHDVIPLVRINPDYPARALSRGVEGWVLIQFDINAIGMVENAVVIDTEPENMFEDAALKAIARWRYNPMIEEGVAVERVGLQTIIRFSLEQ